MAIITLTTDFGARDWFVGTIKGVIAGIAAQAGVIDLTHEIPPGDISSGAFSLLSGYSFFPASTIHVAVVDPGVGSARRPIAVKTSRFVFLGPDNGILTWALRNEQVIEARLLQNSALFLRSVSQTFHGRDIFAPVAAHLARGVEFESLGPVADDFVKLEWPKQVRRNEVLEGQIIYIDRFGNGITNIPNLEKPMNEGMLCRVQTHRAWEIACAQYYSAVPVSTSVLVPGSTGFLEVAVNGGSAQQALGLKTGSIVRLEHAPPRKGPCQ